MEHFHPLDRLISDTSFSLLESLVPFVDYPYKQMLVLYIKYKEAMAILTCFHNRDYTAQQGFDCHPKSTEDFVCDLCKILPTHYASNLQGMKQMLQVMQAMDIKGFPSKDLNQNNIFQQNCASRAQPDKSLFTSVMDILNDEDDTGKIEM